eukprot:Polyplicarium_translucidae@DN2479_c0_g2_i1.p1
MQDVDPPKGQGEATVSSAANTLSGESTTATSSSRESSAKRKFDEQVADLLGFDKESLAKMLKTVSTQRNDESRRYQREIRDLQRQLKRREIEYIRKIKLHLDLSEAKAGHEAAHVSEMESEISSCRSQVEKLEADLETRRRACSRAAELIRRSKDQQTDFATKIER